MTILTTDAPVPGQVKPAMLAELRTLLGESSVLTGPSLAQRCVTDWSEAEASPPIALLLPRTPGQTAAALRVCNRHGQPVSVQGGLTGLAGGANPQRGEIALSLARLDAIEEIDTAAGVAIVQAGVTLERLQETVAAHGWSFPLDLGARGSCQLGGNAATNAGGIRVLRYGMMRNLVLGLEVALPDGTLLTMLDRVVKNNAGFDLKQLFIGSEGALGVITRLSLSLTPRPVSQLTALCAIDSFPAALSLLRESKAQLAGLSSFELMWSDFYEASVRIQGRKAPFDRAYPLYALIETSGTSEAQCEAAMQQFLEPCLEACGIEDVVVAQSLAQSRQLWAIREGVSELLSACKPCAAFDVSVAISKMDELVKDLRASLEQAFPRLRHLFFGHLGDGNLHLISGPFGSPRELAWAEEMVYETIGRFHGSVSAEHGIGTVKKSFLHHSRSSGEIELMRRLKGVVDPMRILNRGRVIS
jgi:FAD/FMN-containing dehydrogenase